MFKKKWKSSNNNNAGTKIRTWVTAATTQYLGLTLRIFRLVYFQLHLAMRVPLLAIIESNKLIGRQHVANVTEGK